MKNSDLDKIYKFIKDINEFKSVDRLSLIRAGGRRESDAEHSWHLSMFVMLLAPLYNSDLDILKCLKMALIHDLVELYSGDRYAFDPNSDRIGKKNAEKKAITILKKQLPKILGIELYQLWVEYDNRLTEESKFVWALDKLLPRILWVLTAGDLSDKMPNDQNRRDYQDREIRQVDTIFKYLIGLYEAEKN